MLHSRAGPAPVGQRDPALDLAGDDEGRSSPASCATPVQPLMRSSGPG
ncbi:hypothetical protein AB0D40_31520 [Streptomyces massasporeus]